MSTDSRSGAKNAAQSLAAVVARSRPAAEALSLVDVRATHISADLVGPGLAPPFTVQAAASGRFGATASTCGIQIEYIAEATTERDEPVWRAEVALHLEYRLLEGAVMPDTDVLDAYAGTAAPFAAHPFAREALHSLTSRLGVPPFVLPTMLSIARDPSADADTPA